MKDLITMISGTTLMVLAFLVGMVLTNAVMVEFMSVSNDGANFLPLAIVGTIFSIGSFNLVTKIADRITSNK